jgi:hypothetical protein
MRMTVFQQEKRAFRRVLMKLAVPYFSQVGLAPSGTGDGGRETIFSRSIAGRNRLYLIYKYIECSSTRRRGDFELYLGFGPSLESLWEDGVTNLSLGQILFLLGYRKKKSGATIYWDYQNHTQRNLYIVLSARIIQKTLPKYEELLRRSSPWGRKRRRAWYEKRDRQIHRCFPKQREVCDSEGRMSVVDAKTGRPIPNYTSTPSSINLRVLGMPSGTDLNP